MAAPKPKYIEPILTATYNRNDFKEVMTALHQRLGDSAWSVAFKALLVIHIMVREGDPEVTLKFLSSRPKYLNLDHFRTGRSKDSAALLRYGKYLSVRAQQYGQTKIDFVKDAQLNDKGVLSKLSVEKGLLREVESVELQIRQLINCRYSEPEVNNEIVLTCFRMLVTDLLSLFQALNEGVINILEHYFEMSRYDAERALGIYKEFTELTESVVKYLRIAKHLEYATKVFVPTIRHAPTALFESLENYLHDPNFEVNRSQYLAEREYKKNGAVTPQQKTDQVQQPKVQQHPQQQHPQQQQPVANPWGAPLNLQPLQVQYTQGLQPQNTNNPFLAQMQQQQQPQLQRSLTQIQPQQQTVPTIENAHTGGFGFAPASSIVPAFTGAGFGGYSVQQQPTGNPFEQQKQLQQAQQVQQVQQTQQTQAQQNQAPPKLRASSTGNNPFSLNYRSTNLSSISEQTSVEPQATNNPFASKHQSLPAQTTGTNPFLTQTSSNTMTINGTRVPVTIGGYEQLPTQPVFPQTIQDQLTNQFAQQASWEIQGQMQQNRESAFQQQPAGQQHFQQQPTGQQFQQQQTGQQQFQPQFTGFAQNAYSAYNGPSLI